MEHLIFCNLETCYYVIKDEELYMVKDCSFILCRSAQIETFFKKIIEYELKKDDCLTLATALERLKPFINQLGYSIEYFNLHNSYSNFLTEYVKLQSDHSSVHYKRLDCSKLDRLLERQYLSSKKRKIETLKLECEKAGIDIDSIKNIEIKSKATHVESVLLDDFDLETPLLSLDSDSKFFKT